MGLLLHLLHHLSAAKSRIKVLDFQPKDWELGRGTGGKCWESLASKVNQKPGKAITQFYILSNRNLSELPVVAVPAVLEFQHPVLICPRHRSGK